MRRFWLGALLLLASGTAAWCGPASSATPNPKPPLQGLISMGNITFHRVDGGVPDNSLPELTSIPGILDGVVINVTWAQLQPTPGAAISTVAIDDTLARIRAYNRQYANHPLAVRLRVWGGPNAPDWIKRLGGAPISVLHRSMPETVGRFWSPAYRQAWRALQDQLAARYDSEPLIREVTNSSCSSITDEPFIFPGEASSLANLHQAGFNDAQYGNCLMNAPADYTGWRSTRIEYPVNPYRAADSGHPVPMPDFTILVMTNWRKTLGIRGVLSNHSLDNPVHPNMVPLYQEMAKLGPPFEFQTNSPNGQNWVAALRYGISLGATAIELWPGGKFGGFLTLPPTQLQQWSAEIERNRTP